jgi:hypothetical protein
MTDVTTPTGGTSINTPMTSIIGSVALAGAGLVVGWLASHNIIPAADVTADTALVCSLIVGAIGAGIVWFKAHMATPAAHIAAVNSDTTPGVKVVSSASASPQVNAPIPPTAPKVS